MDQRKEFESLRQLPLGVQGRRGISLAIPGQWGANPGIQSWGDRPEARRLDQVQSEDPEDY